MKRRLSLFIADQLVEIEDDSFVLMTYQMEDLTSPADVKNSYSQQITIKGTPNNNKIFGGLFRSDRNTIYSSSLEHGAYFDPCRKTPFKIMNELGEIIESGYCKVDKIKKNKGSVEYAVTLFGSLGSFFYSLSYDSDGNKKTLADLRFTGENADEHELDFVITAPAVKSAWNQLYLGTHTNPIWDIINFAPCYNGIPGGSFDADKALVNVAKAKLKIPSGYVSDEWVLAKFSEKHTEWETHDLRSYLQRPVINMRKVIDAISQPYNNGGYQVEIDPDFISDQWQYINSLWMTLPLLNSMDINIDQASGSLIPTLDMDIDIPDGGNESATYKISFDIKPKINVTGVSGDRYLHVEDDWTDGEITWESHYLNYIEFQLIGYDVDGNVRGGTIIDCSSRQGINNGEAPEIDFIGHFDQQGNWVGDQITIGLEARGISSVRLHMALKGVSWGMPKYPVDPYLVWGNTENYSDNYAVTSQTIAYNADNCKYEMASSDTSRSGATITKKMLLSSDTTPADYLLSFAKVFGLVFLFEKDNNKIKILQRKNFYQDKIVDISSRIETTSPEFLPFAFDSRWYDFTQQNEGGEFADYYSNLYKRTFGLQRVNTGYEFNAEPNDVMKDVVFPGCCEVMEHSKYFCDIINGGSAYYPAIFQDGGTYTLRKSNGDTEDLDLPTPGASSVFSWWNTTAKTYDFQARPQFHGKDNSALDNRDTLLFLYSFKNIPSGVRLSLSDDNAEMMLRNENTPCWILDNGLVNPSLKVTELPNFCRYAMIGNNVERSLDFGTPYEVAIPEANFQVNSNIYDRFWKRYISDRYDDDSRVMTCKVDLSGLMVNESLFRQFYFYDGAIWALNKISNHSLTTYDFTECEFIKVQDINNYLN